MAAKDELSGSSEIVWISDGLASLGTAPGIGGAIAAFRWDTGEDAVDWLRPASRQALETRDAGEMACFPLFPFSNRARNGRLTFAGQDVLLPVSPQDPHFEHGHGWRNAWKVVEKRENGLSLEYEHTPDTWPWHYRASQRFELKNGALSVGLALTNLSQMPMPAGMGLHPYFPATQDTRLYAAVEQMWATDSEVLPTRLVKLAAHADPNSGLDVARAELDNVFTRWNRMAHITWPENRRSLRMTASGPLDFLVLYTPSGEPYFCAEPVSNATDAFNLAAAGEKQTGMIVLEPGHTIEARVDFVPGIQD